MSKTVTIRANQQDFATRLRRAMGTEPRRRGLLHRLLRRR